MRNEPSKGWPTRVVMGRLVVLVVVLLLLGAGMWLFDFHHPVLPPPPVQRIDLRPTPLEPLSFLDAHFSARLIQFQVRLFFYGTGSSLENAMSA